MPTEKGETISTLYDDYFFFFILLIFFLNEMLNLTVLFGG